jgi:hypothetical protein
VWKFIARTPLFLHIVPDGDHRGVTVRARYQDQIQEKIVYSTGNVQFDFPNSPQEPGVKSRLAVASIQVEGIPESTLGKAVTDYIVGKIRPEEKFFFIERNQIADMLKDVSFVHPEHTKNLFPEVDALLLGRIGYASGKYTLSFRLVATQNATILSNESDTTENREEIFSRALLVLR